MWEAEGKQGREKGRKNEREKGRGKKEGEWGRGRVRVRVRGRLDFLPYELKCVFSLLLI